MIPNIATVIGEQITRHVGNKFWALRTVQAVPPIALYPPRSVDLFVAAFTNSGHLQEPRVSIMALPVACPVLRKGVTRKLVEKVFRVLIVVVTAHSLQLGL